MRRRAACAPGARSLRRQRRNDSATRQHKGAFVPACESYNRARERHHAQGGRDAEDFTRSPRRTDGDRFFSLFFSFFFLFFLSYFVSSLAQCERARMCRVMPLRCDVLWARSRRSFPTGVLHAYRVAPARRILLPVLMFNVSIMV